MCAVDGINGKVGIGITTRDAAGKLASAANCAWNKEMEKKAKHEEVCHAGEMAPSPLLRLLPPELGCRNHFSSMVNLVLHVVRARSCFHDEN
ncbi:hypothetical protein QYF36_005458 [Acer negundo]|nr:hypothetical protein QYF36_005458 [Acer negundo]